MGEEVYAILVQGDNLKEGSQWFGQSYESLQASRMKYQAGKAFRIHHHILNPRTIKRTQEAFVVVSGRLAADIYDNKANLIGTLEAGPGEAILIYRGGHGIRIVEDSVVYEIKAGQYSVPSEDKEFLNG